MHNVLEHGIAQHSDAIGRGYIKHTVNINKQPCRYRSTSQPTT